MKHRTYKSLIDYDKVNTSRVCQFSYFLTKMNIMLICIRSVTWAGPTQQTRAHSEILGVGQHKLTHKFEVGQKLQSTNNKNWVQLGQLELSNLMCNDIFDKYCTHTYIYILSWLIYI